jgi:accessory gene regulator B
MIERVAGDLALYFHKRGVYTKIQIEAYSYGFQLLLSTVINALVLIVISIVLNVLVEGVFFNLVFIGLRVTAGGYHAKSHKSCILMVCCVYSLMAVLTLSIPDGMLSTYSLVCSIYTALVIWKYSPVEVKNKPLAEKQKQRLHDQSLMIASILLFIALLQYVFPGISSKLIAFGMSGALTASTSALFVAKTYMKGDSEHEESNPSY